MKATGARATRLADLLGAPLVTPDEHGERWLASLQPASTFTFLWRRAALGHSGPEEVHEQIEAEAGALRAAALDAACGASAALHDLQSRFLGEGWTALVGRLATLRAALRPEPPFPPGIGQPDVDAFIVLGEHPGDDEAQLDPSGERALAHLRGLREAQPARYERLETFNEDHDRLNNGGQVPRLAALVSELKLGQAFRTSWQLAFGAKARARPKLPSYLAQAILVAADVEDRLVLGEVLNHLGLLQTAVSTEPPTKVERAMLRKEVENGRAFWVRLGRNPASRARYATPSFVLELVEWTTHQRLAPRRTDSSTA